MIPLEPDGFSLEWVSALPLFHDLLPRELETARALLRRQKLPINAELVAPDAGGEALYFLARGALKVRAQSGPNEIIVEMRGPGSLSGALSVFDGGALLHVCAQMPCELAVLSRHDFWNTVWPMGAVPFNVAHLLAERVRRRDAQILEIGTLDVPSRLARQLARLAHEHGQLQEDGSIELPFPLKQTELAQMVGTSRVHVNQTLARWNGGELVSFQRGKIVINDPQALGKLAEAP